MKAKIPFCLTLVVSYSLILIFIGCRGMGTQSFTAFAPEQAGELESSSQTMLDVTCTQFWKRADYNLQENLSMLAPMTKHWKYDMTLQVERVIKGEYKGTTLQLHWLREPTSEQCDLLGISQPWPFGSTNGTPLRIGFDGHSGEQFKNLKIIVRP